MYFSTTIAEIWSALLILFDLLKNAVYIPCPINNNFALEASLLQKTPAVIHWPPDRSVIPIRPRDYLLTPLVVQLTPGVDIDHFENHWSNSSFAVLMSKQLVCMGIQTI